MRRAIAFCFVALGAWSLVGAQSRRTPNLEFESLGGAKERIGDLRGSIAVVNFWATWCGPCRQEFPMLSQLAGKFAGRKVRFVAISADDDPKNRKQRAKIDQFLNEQKPAMEIWLDADLDALQRCGLGNVLPATMILDENGQIVFRIEGQAREEDIGGPVEWLLDGGGGTSPPAVVKRY